MSKQIEIAVIAPHQDPFPATWAWSTFSVVAHIASNLVDPGGFPDMPHIAPNHIERDTGRLLPYNTIVQDGVTSGKHRFYAGQILYSKIRPYLNKCTIARFDGLCSADMYPVDAHVDATYLCHYMLTRRFVDAVSEAAGSRTVLPKTNQKQMADVPVPVPPLPEQHRIVAEIEKQFTRLDAAVANLERVKANLKRARASVLKAAVEGRLVSTEAALARAEGRDYEPASVLLERILEERKRKHEETNGKKKYKPPVEPDAEGLPELPAGWAWASAEQLFWDGSYGTSVKCSEYASGAPVLRIPNVQAGAVRLDDMKYATDDSKLKADGDVAPGDFIFIRTNGSRRLIGRGALVIQELPDHHYASYLIRLRLLGEVSLQRWVALSWHGPGVRTQILSDAASSAGQYNVSLGKAKSYHLAVPPSAEHRRILAEAERRLSVLDALQKMVAVNLARCNRLRQSILKRAFEGKLVPQDPNDEPANELLARILAEAEAAKPKRTKKKSTRRKKTTA